MLLKHKEGSVIKFQNQDISYTDLFSRIHIFSELINVKKGDRVIIFGENSPGWIYALYSIFENEAIAVPVDYLSSSKELEHILKDCEPSAIFYSEDSEKTLTETLERTNIGVQLVKINNFENKTFKPNTKALKIPNEEDTAIIIYTSGTTGSPKGVMLSFKNLQANIDGVSKGIEIYNAQRSVMILLPLHHIFPLVGSCLTPLSVGSMVAICPSLSPKDILDTLQKNSISIIIGVPRLYSALRKGIVDKIEKNAPARNLFKLARLLKSKSFSKFLFKSVHKKFGGNIKFLVSGGAALDKYVASDFQTLGFNVLEGFGMSEAAPMISFTRPNKLKIGSAGQAVPNTELKIKDGEILSRGPHIMQGYYKRPKETAEVIKDGWLHSGDLGRLDEKGRLFITGRKKEIIVLSNGKNVNPVELENQLEKDMPYIKELAIFENKDKLQLIIVPDNTLAQKLGINDIETHTLNNVLKIYNQTVSTYKKIYRLYIYNGDLPRTRLSKIQRFKLKDVIQPTNRQTDSAEENYTSKEFELIKKHIREDKGIEVLPSDHIEFDLSLDSLEKVSLQVYIENTFGVDIKAEKISEHETLQKLSEFVKKMKTKIKTETVNWEEIFKERVNLKLNKSHFSFWLTIKSLRLFFSSYLRYRITGKENIPQSPCIIAANHQSYIDGMLVASAFKSKTLVNSYFFTKAKHVKNKLTRFFAKKNNIIVVDINKDLKISIQTLATALKQGKNIIIFPEGTRSTTEEMGEFKKTFAILSKELNVPIVPVAICGAHRVLPKGKHFPKPFKKVSVNFLKPIFPENHSYETLTVKTKQIIQKYLEDVNNNLQSSKQ